MTLEDPNPRTIERNVREFLTPSRPLNGRGISPSADHVIVVTLDPKIVALLRKAKLPGTFRVITLGK
jgi:hypothetical protein